MLQLKHASHGTQMASLPAMFINDYFADKFNVMVDVPVVTQKTLLVFSIERELEKRKEFASLSKQSYATLIGTVSSALASMDEGATKKAVKKAGVDIPDDILESVIYEVKKEVTKQISGAGVASILVNDVLQAKIDRVEPLKDVKFNEILAALSRVQGLYGSFADSESLAKVGEQIQSMFTTEPVFAHVHAMMKTFTQHKSATVKARLTYALDTMYAHTFGESIMDVETKISGMHYEIKQLNIFKDVKYRQVVCMYFIALRGMMGIGKAEEGESSTDLSSLIDHFIINAPGQMPALPKDLACTTAEIKQVQTMFCRMWLLNLYHMILTNNEGQLSHQIHNVMEERKYTRNETWDGMIRDGITIASFIFESFVKTAAQFRDWAKDEKIYFATDNSLPYNLRLKLNKFVFQVVDGYNSFLPMEHPRFLFNPAHIINYSTTTMGAQTIQYFIPDAELRFSKAQWIITPELDRTLIYQNKTLSGSNLDVKIDVARPFLPLSQKITPKLGFTLTRPALFGGDITAAFLGIKSLKSIIEATDIPGEIVRHAELVFIRDKSDLAEHFEIPVEMAEEIFTGAEMYASLEKQSLMFITWDHAVAPVVEFSSLEENRSYVPFVAHWPYLLTYSNKLPSIVGLPGTKDNKSVIDPKKPKGKTETTDTKGEEETNESEGGNEE